MYVFSMKMFWSNKQKSNKTKVDLIRIMHVHEKPAHFRHCIFGLNKTEMAGEGGSAH